MVKFFDTHCHLDYLKDAPLSEIIDKSLKAGVDKMTTIATEPDNLDRVIEIASEFSNVFCTQGIHPHDAKTFTPEVKNKIISNIKRSQKVVALGEIGLDYHYNLSSQKDQLHAFEVQMQIAIDHDLPIVIHTREAEDDTWSILKNFSKYLKKPLVLHSFTSKKSLAEKALSEHFFIGFNGIITFKNAQNVRDVLDIVPLSNLLIETDAPFLTPVPHRGKENASFYLPHIGEFICKHKGLSEEDALSQIYQNSIEFFGL